MNVTTEHRDDRFGKPNFDGHDTFPEHVDFVDLGNIATKHYMNQPQEDQNPLPVKLTWEAWKGIED